MIRRRFLSTTLAGLSSLALLLSACGGTTSDAGASAAPIGDPVAGGSVRVVQISEPRNLDPAVMSNTWVQQGLLGNALYGTLMVNDPETTEISYKMATDLSTADGGKTFVLKLRPGLIFTDGTPLDAAAVKFNWGRLADSTTGTGSRNQALTVAGTTVLDAGTLEIDLVTPNPTFPQAIVTSGMNWIASPTALAGSREAFDANPVGAGPFTLVSWTRQDALELERNDKFYDAPKPYLDKLVLRSSGDTNQRLNSVVSGGADLAFESNWEGIAKADDAGLTTEVLPMGGGQYLAMNTRTAPFNDERARRAVSLAVDLDALNLSVFNGKGVIPDTMFIDSSDFYADVPLAKYDPEQAQKLFNELAAEGKPVKFRFTAYSTLENKVSAESVQAQLSTFDNVDISVNVVDVPSGIAQLQARDFEMFMSGANGQEPDQALWRVFNSKSVDNVTGISDPELDAALDEGRVSTDLAERQEAYKTAQERIAALTVGVWYTRSTPGVIARTAVQGIDMYGFASMLPEELWVGN